MMINITVILQHCKMNKNENNINEVCKTSKLLPANFIYISVIFATFPTVYSSFTKL